MNMLVSAKFSQCFILALLFGLTCHAGTIEGSGFKFGQWIDTVMMQYSMNGGAEKLPDTGKFPASDWQVLNSPRSDTHW